MYIFVSNNNSYAPMNSSNGYNVIDRRMCGCRRVQNNNNRKYNWLNDNNELISRRWFEWVSNFNPLSKTAFVQIGCKYNIINTNGEILCNKWFTDAYNFKDDCTIVKIHKQWWLLHSSGSLIMKWPKGNIVIKAN